MTYQPETFTVSLTAEVEEVSFQYAFTLNTRGLVHEVNSPFFDLPPAAQKLIVGDKSIEIIDKIKNRGTLFQYELLLALHGKTENLSAQITALAQTIEDKLKANSLSWKELVLNNHRFDVVDWFRTGVNKRSSRSNDSSPEKFLTHMSALVSVPEGPVNQHRSLSDAMRYFGYYGGGRGHDFLALLIPFQKGNSRRVLLEAFKHEQREENKVIMLRQLAIPNNGQWVGGALDTLARYSDPEITKAGIALFEREENLSEDALANLARILGASPQNEASINVIQTILRKRLRHSSNSAAQVLAKIPGQQQIMIDEALPVLRGKDKTAVEGAFSVLLALDDQHLPDGDTLWDIYLSALSLSPNLNLAYSMPSLLQKVKVPDLNAKILSALNHPKAGVLRSTLVIISCSFNSSYKADKYFVLDDKIIQRIFQLFSHQDRDTSREAVKIAGRLEPADLPESIIADLVNLYKDAITNNRFHLRLDILGVLNMLFKKITYDPIVEDICLEALKDDNYNIKVAAINVLLRSSNPEVKRRLEEMRNDPQQEVRNALQQKEESIMGMDPDTFSKFLSDDAFRGELMKQLEQERQQQKLDKPTTEKSSSLISKISRFFGKQ